MQGHPFTIKIEEWKKKKATIMESHFPLFLDLVFSGALRQSYSECCRNGPSLEVKLLLSTFPWNWDLLYCYQRKHHCIMIEESTCHSVLKYKTKPCLRLAHFLEEGCKPTQSSGAQGKSWFSTQTGSQHQSLQVGPGCCKKVLKR